MSTEKGSGGEVNAETAAAAAVVDDDECWYKSPTSGTFFSPRRVPFFIFNFAVYACALCLFVWMSYAITEDYIDQQRNPPTSSKLQDDVAQAFPGNFRLGLLLFGFVSSAHAFSNHFLLFAHH